MTSYRNPILPGFNPDPSICRAGDDYFIATSTFQFFPGVPIYHSRDLVNWKLIGHALNRRSQLELRTTEGGGGIFAPTLRYWKGRFYMTTCCAYRIRFGSKDPFVTPRGFYVWTDNIFDQSKWSEPVYFDMLGIDQDLFFDDTDDRVYLSTTARIYDPHLPRYGFDTGVFISEIDLDSGRIRTRPKFIRQSPIGIGIAEGSHIFRKDGYYYLITAEGGTETLHQEWVFRSKEGPYGPWEAGPEGVNPMVFQGQYPDEEIQYTGHMDLVDAPDGRWWAVMLGVREQRDGPKKGKEVIWSQLGRETFLCPVDWQDGWPIVNHRQPLRIKGEQGTGLAMVSPEIKWRDDFQQTDLQLGWYTVRTPNTDFYSLTERPSTLTIHGSPYYFTDDESPSMLLRRQDAFEGVWQTELDFAPSAAGEEAGTTVWWSKWAFASVGLRGTGEEGNVGREVLFRNTVLEDDDVHETVFDASALEGPLRLTIQATRFKYSLYCQSAESNSDPLDLDKMTKVGEISARVLTKQGMLHSVMTGTHFGLYAMGAHHEPSFAPAHFSYASWQAKRE